MFLLLPDKRRETMSTWMCIKTTIEPELWASLCCHVITQHSYHKTYILQFWCLKQYIHCMLSEEYHWRVAETRHYFLVSQLPATKRRVSICTCVCAWELKYSFALLPPTLQHALKAMNSATSLFPPWCKRIGDLEGVFFLFSLNCFFSFHLLKIGQKKTPLLRAHTSQD